jgi:KAP family P-loop domain
LEGRWGAGKSLVVQYLQDHFNSSRGSNRQPPAPRPWDQVAFVHIDVWREQSEADLHLEIIENIFSEPKVLRTGFRYYPISRIFWRQVGEMFSRLFSAGVKLKRESFEAQLSVPRSALPMMAQNDFERVVGGLRHNGLLTVVILDELDRAIPAVTQAALALAQRALHLPGVLVVMPFVRSQFRQKVFNPMLAHSPDLYSTFMAQVAHAAQMKREELSERPDSDYRRFGPQLWRPAVELDAFSVAEGDSGAADEGDKPTTRRAAKVAQQAPKEGPVGLLSKWRALRWLGYEDQLLRYLNDLHPMDLEVLYDQAAEKYLSESIQIHGPDAQDLIHMLTFPRVQSALPYPELAQHIESDEDFRSKLVEDLRTSLAAFEEQERRESPSGFNNKSDLRNSTHKLKLRPH